MTVSAATRLSSEVRTCRKCERELPLDIEHFRQVLGGRPTTKNRKLYWTRTCRQCEAQQSAEYYAEARDHVLAQQRSVRRDRRKYGREYHRRNRKKLNRQRRERDRLRRRRLVAPIPWPVIKPYLERSLRETFRPIAITRMPHHWQDADQRLGIGPMAQAASVSERELRRIFNGEVRGVNLQIVDRLARYCDFTVQEMTDRATEWALLTGDSWPDGPYKVPKDSRTKRPRTA